MSGWRKALIIAVLGLFGTSALAGVVVGHWYSYVHSPIEGLEVGASVSIPEGSDFDAVMDLLKAEGLVSAPLYFKVLVRVRKADRRVRAGRYDLPEGTTPGGLLDRITRSGPDGTIRLTVPEGFTMYHVADRVEAEGLATKAEFLETATEGAFLKRLGIRGPSVEGYLFPDTYFFAPGATTRAVIGRMVRRHRQVWKAVEADVGQEASARHKAAHKISNRELVILASIVEREAVVDDERPIIARVFYNRLEAGMKLQTDPTCVYGPEIYKKKPKPSLCRDKKSRYSTYVIKGLPPGPVANAGRASLRAVLAPTTKKGETEYLYFVAKRGGRRHTFSKTYEAHRKAIPR